MKSSTGKLIRLGRIVHPDTHRAVAVAYSHGVLRGALPGLRTREEINTVLPALRAADAVMVSPGLLPHVQHFFVGSSAPALIIQVDWHNVGRAKQGEFPGHGGASTAIATAEQAVAAGADAIMTYLWLGGPDPDREREEIRRNAEIARACDQVGLPLLIESRWLTEETNPDGSTNAELIKFHTRVAAELGADFIKTLYSGDINSFREVTLECPVPVLLAGGERLETVANAASVVEQAVDAGAAGVVFGRNIFQFPDPADVLQRLVDVVHGKTGPT